MISQNYYNPYSGKNFFEFLIELFVRLYKLLTGSISFQELASDEIQILVLCGVAASSALVGVFMVLRKMTMLANSLSHTILVGIVIAFMWSYGISGSIHQHYEPIDIHILMICSMIMGLITAFLTELLTKGAKLQEDASIGVVFTSLFAVGVIGVTLLTRSVHLGTEAVMGNVDALQLSDCLLVYIVLAINTALFIVFFKEFAITTFDAGLSRSFRISPAFFSYLLMTQVSLTAIGAFRAVGVLMLLAFIVGPPLTARILSKNLKHMLVLAVFFGVFCSIIGVALSRHILTVSGVALSTSGVVVCVIVIIYIFAAIYSEVRRRYGTLVRHV